METSLECHIWPLVSKIPRIGWIKKDFRRDLSAGRTNKGKEADEWVQFEIQARSPCSNELRGALGLYEDSSGVVRRHGGFMRVYITSHKTLS